MERNRTIARRFDANYSTGKDAANAALARADVTINADNRKLRGRAAISTRYAALKTAFPDLSVKDEYVIVDGARAALEYVISGTQTGPYKAKDGTVLAPTGKAVHVRGLEFMDFDDTGLLKNLIIIQNNDDFATQLQH